MSLNETFSCKDEREFLNNYSNNIKSQLNSHSYGFFDTERARLKKLLQLPSNDQDPKWNEVSIFVKKILQKNNNNNDNNDNNDNNNDNNNNSNDNNSNNNNQNDNDNDDDNDSSDNIPEIFSSEETKQIRSDLSSLWTNENNRIAFLRNIGIYEKCFPSKIALAERAVRHFVVGAVS